MTEVLELHYSPEQIAVAAGIDRRTVLRLIKSGEIRPAFKPSENVIRVPASAVNDWLRRSCVSPTR